MQSRLYATETSIHICRVFENVNFSSRVVYVETSKNEDTWYKILDD